MLLNTKKYENILNKDLRGFKDNYKLPYTITNNDDYKEEFTKTADIEVSFIDDSVSIVYECEDTGILGVGHLFVRNWVRICLDVKITHQDFIYGDVRCLPIWKHNLKTTRKVVYLDFDVSDLPRILKQKSNIIKLEKLGEYDIFHPTFSGVKKQDVFNK